MKYKVGDKVRVRKDLKLGNDYWNEDKDECWNVTDNMFLSVGKVVTIKSVSEGCHYTIEGGEHFDWWTDEMFEGLAEEKPTPKFKIGDKVKVVKVVAKHKKGDIGKVFTIRELNSNGEGVFNEPHYGVIGDTCYVWLESELELVVEETPTPEPIQVNVNININIDNYANACWYCRKGGVVDLYFNGQLGVCPHCGRVCNRATVEEMTKSHKLVNPVKKENKPLTTEELKALPAGTRVFTVWLSEVGVEKWDDNRTRWRIKRKDGQLRWENDAGWIGIESNGKAYLAYLEEPERPLPELPF